MDDRVLEIVFYLMDYLHDGHSQVSNLSDVSLDLRGLGFSDEEISQAYSWILEHFQSSREQLYSAIPEKTDSVRVLTDMERTLLTLDAHALLVRLTESRLINPLQFEETLERCAIFGQQPVSVDHLKLIISLVAFGEHENLDRTPLFGDDSDRLADVN